MVRIWSRYQVDKITSLLTFGCNLVVWGLRHEVSGMWYYTGDLGYVRGNPGFPYYVCKPCLDSWVHVLLMFMHCLIFWPENGWSAEQVWVIHQRRSKARKGMKKKLMQNAPDKISFNLIFERRITRQKVKIFLGFAMKKTTAEIK